jgi:hypothetical protein
MPSKQVRIETDTIYRSETPLRQKKFPNRRRTVRSSGIGTSAPLRQQSTLTQQPHWPVSRSSSNAEIEDEIEDQDEDYQEDELERSRPRRKKRKSEVDGKRQMTMTQYVPSSFIQERDDGASNLPLQFDDPDSFDGVRDSQSQPILAKYDNDPEAGVEALNDGCVYAVSHGDAEMQENQEEHSQRSQSSSQGEERIDSVFAKQQARQRPSPELPISAMTLRTPKRRFMSEIPSSNTPQSAIISICSAKSIRSPERSPLRNKSMNAWSQNHAAEDIRMSPVPESPTKPMSPFRLSPVKNRPIFRVPDKPPTLQHRSTIPDSEDTATQVTPAKQKKFRSQIPDTQMDSFGEEITAVTETQLPVNNYTQYLGGTYYAENDDYDYNFDPVGSALDRDAARFMQTQLLRDRLGYNAFHKTRSFSQDDEQQEENETEQKRVEEHEDINLVNVQQSQELGDELPVTNSRVEETEQDYEDPPTQSPRSSPQQPPVISYESGEIEEIDLSGDIVLPKTSIREVIHIASSPNSKSVSSGKYPSSPPLVVENDARLRAEAEAEEQLNNNKNNTERHSSPLLPIILPIPPSQISTVGGTQLFHSLKRSTQKAACLSSSPPPLPPSTSSPPLEAKQRFRKFLDMYDSDDEDDMQQDEPEIPDYGEEDDGMDLDFAPQRPPDIDHTVEDDPDDESEDEGGYSRLRDILPDTLFDFSLPPPPTQSSVRSSRS